MTLIGPEASASFFAQPGFLMISTCIVIVYPMCCIRSLRILSYTSLLSFASMLYITSAIFGSFLYDLWHNPIVLPIPEAVHRPFNFFQSVFPAFSIMGMAYMMQINILEVSGNMKPTLSGREPPQSSRKRLLMALSIGIATIIYQIMGFTGYFHYGNKVRSFREPLNNSFRHFQTFFRTCPSRRHLLLHALSFSS